ncbi:E3 ubiquitin-protein ligase RNF138 isoform X3 [Dendrobates tinctorius]|uniref:E3 ubiquitin-protein ligase RNF138 isoform X3 n=1 Tax=Dendrobates tinctorius TaxID=92724 RepID=UPI003CC93ACF
MAEAKPSTSVVLDSSELEAFRCPFCQNIFKTPVRTHDCHHVSHTDGLHIHTETDRKNRFCRKCLLTAVTSRGPHCPICRLPLYRWETTTPTRACDIETKMKTLSHACLSCRRQVKLSYTRLHYKSCKKHQEAFAGAPRVSLTLPSESHPTKRPDLIYKCPLCQQDNLNRKDLLEHCNAMHSLEVAQVSMMTSCRLRHRFHQVCPICSALPGGDANYASRDIVGHLNARHQFNYGDFMKRKPQDCL